MTNHVTALYFSPTLTTKKVVTTIARGIAERLHISYSEVDITTLAQREGKLVFDEGDLVVFGAPVYIGRMPNLISPYFKTITGGGALGVPVAVYGNRAYDDGLIELRDIMEEDGFRLVAAGAFVGEHTFSRILGGGRPDGEDLGVAERFACEIAQKVLLFGADAAGRVEVPGTPYPYSGFYKATDTSKKSVDIRKVVPQTDLTKCDGCGLCAKMCAMGAIDFTDCTQVVGKCIKCGACIKRCPRGAKYFDDPQYLSHLALLEEKFTSPRREPELFFPLK